VKFEQEPFFKHAYDKKIPLLLCI